MTEKRAARQQKPGAENTKKRHFDSLLQLFAVASNLALSAKAVAIAAAHINAMSDMRQQAALQGICYVGNSHVE